MQIRKLGTFLPIGLGVLLLIGMVLLLPASSADAQCGSQASSCKNCHETQGKGPVNADGTGWHTGHAFGDFCYICHAGNNQSMDQEQAHAGMVDPLSDVNAACASCHPADLMERANVYSAALGVEVGTGGGTTNEPPASNSPQSGEPVVNPPAEPAAPDIVLPSEAVVDYNQIYDETVLGKNMINWGNVILWLIILAVAVGGGFFIYWNERRQRGLPLRSAKPEAGTKASEAPVVEGYSTEVSGLLPLIAQLNPTGLHSLRKVLANPDQANMLLHSMAQLDPELIRRLRSLDRDSRSLLLAITGD